MLVEYNYSKDNDMLLNTSLEDDNCSYNDLFDVHVWYLNDIIFNIYLIYIIL